jgi:hypothetical protein
MTEDRPSERRGPSPLVNSLWGAGRLPTGTPVTPAQRRKNRRTAIIAYAILLAPGLMSGLATGFATHNYVLGIGVGVGTYLLITVLSLFAAGLISVRRGSAAAKVRR